MMQLAHVRFIRRVPGNVGRAIYQGMTYSIKTGEPAVIVCPGEVVLFDRDRDRLSKVLRHYGGKLASVNVTCRAVMRGKSREALLADLDPARQPCPGRSPN